eukprot:jgi/Botrbrau1/3666/Bobra.0008s0001.1
MEACSAPGSSKGCKRARSSPSGRSCPRGGLLHKETEQKRRDRINAGFEALRDTIPVGEKKVDKAGFLHEAVNYIRDLQGLLRQCVEVGGLKDLSEDAQWSYRMLLPQMDVQQICKQSPFEARELAKLKEIEEDPLKSGSAAIIEEYQPSISASAAPFVLPLGSSALEVNPTKLLHEMLLQHMQQQQALVSLLCAWPAEGAEVLQECYKNQQATAGPVALLHQLQSHQLLNAPIGLPILPLQVSALPLQPVVPTQHVSEALHTTRKCYQHLDTKHAQVGAEAKEGTAHPSSSRSVAGRPTKFRKCNTAAILSKPLPYASSGFTHPAK